ncbi:transcription repressor OFP8-like [Phragmites australis]|uniref:transcription repressor OFP8-like n=1 Tax=Phragmites australis TaxID=29695 RepID=UPI002D792D97|nr:transcription repressor OFP8-like [Phragmites australis]
MWSPSTATIFTSSTTTTATMSSSVDNHSSWGPAIYAVANTNTLYKAEAEARDQRWWQSWSGMEQYGSRIAEKSIAVEVESTTPYKDFRESMVAMVTEKELYAWEELNTLLH